MKRVVMCVAIIVFLVNQSLAQDSNLRVLMHPTFELTNHLFVPVWFIGNAKTKTPNNLNLITGLGYRTDNWWVESMAQRQWSPSGGQWFLNFRLFKSKGRLSIYGEPTIFLTKPAFQESVFVEYRLWHKLALGGETENIHRSRARDTLGTGPRISYALPQWKGVRPVLAFTYQIRKEEQDVMRFYVVLHRRF